MVTTCITASRVGNEYFLSYLGASAIFIFFAISIATYGSGRLVTEKYDEMCGTCGTNRGEEERV
jgi:hypothetical protein